MGSLSVLVPGKGDDNYDFNDPEQATKGMEAIQSMLRGGFFLVAKKVDGSEAKVVSFDASTQTLKLSDQTTVPAMEAETTAQAPASGG